MRRSTVVTGPPSMYMKIKGLLDEGYIVKANGCKIVKEGQTLKYKGVKVTKAQWDALIGEVELETSEGPHPEVTTITGMYNSSSSWGSNPKYSAAKVAHIPEKATVLVIPLQSIQSSLFMQGNHGNQCLHLQLSENLDEDTLKAISKKINTAITRRRTSNG